MANLANWRQPPEGYITIAEAVLRSGYSKSGIVTLAKNGRLLGRLVGTRWYIDGLMLDAYVANRKSRPKRGRPAKTRGAGGGAESKRHDQAAMVVMRCALATTAPVGTVSRYSRA